MKRGGRGAPEKLQLEGGQSGKNLERGLLLTPANTGVRKNQPEEVP